MDISLYDLIVLFIIVPFLLFRFTDIPRWLFSRARKSSPKRLLLAAALLFLCLTVGIATVRDSVWNVRFVSLSVAVLACVLHYIYTDKSDRADAGADGNDPEEK